ncbi:hypothetical protein Y032_0251g178 [Ancylostoma ceylanicum]|uniref:MARVEL domain-containing protein n=1 Tax=Ancylostoma ceylanicum TaxID=53326 RepID=A0A016SC22_9BILA|nr:hypothetical protein Y032_0251g178 [Ancylostoma ceylanicum]
MTCIALHSHFLFILLTTHINMSFFILTAGKHSLSMMTLNITSTTLTQVFHEIQGLKLTVSVILHAVATICVFLVILINNVDRFNSILPSSVVVVILLFTFMFNVVGSILLFSHKSTIAGQRSTVFFGCAILSACAAAFTFGVIAFFIRMPPKKTIIVEVSGATAYKAIMQPPAAIPGSAESLPPPGNRSAESVAPQANRSAEVVPPPPPKPTPAPPIYSPSRRRALYLEWAARRGSVIG